MQTILIKKYHFKIIVRNIWSWKSKFIRSSFSPAELLMVAGHQQKYSKRRELLKARKGIFRCT